MSAQIDKYKYPTWADERKKSMKRKWIKIEFEGMTFRQRLLFWWAITISCLFRKNAKTEIGEIDI